MEILETCIACDGEGNISGIGGYDERGEIIEGFFPCERCNGEGTEIRWYQDCNVCKTTGFVEGAYGIEYCGKCLGRGFFIPEPASKVSRWVKVPG